MRAGATLARAQIITQAFLVGRADPDSWVSYSRRRQFYAERRGRYWRPTYTYDTIVPAVDGLAAIGLFVHEKSQPGHRDWQSRFRASPKLMRLLNETPLSVVRDPLEVIVLRDEDGALIDYDETERSHRWRRNVQEINEATMSAAIGLKGDIIRDGDPLQAGNALIGVASNKLHRVFNRRSFSLGGRFYGGWWQNIPSELRAAITINGIDSVEMDYPRLHPTLLYAEVGAPLHGDPYELPGRPRDLVKIAFNTLVNADTRQAAISSIANEIRGEGAFSKAEALVGEIESKHRPIAHMFGSGAGLRLMRRDSDMTERLLLRLIRRGIVPLPIHDSYIVPDRSPRQRRTHRRHGRSVE